MTLIIALITLRIPADFWIAAVAAYQIPTELPTTVIGLVGLVVIVEGGLIYYLLKSQAAMVDKFIGLAEKNAAGTAATAAAIQELKTAITQGKGWDEVKGLLEQYASEREAAPTGRSRGSGSQFNPKR